jgi:hypothetical protein
MLEEQRFHNSDEVLRFVQERSDDIEKVVIPQHPFISVFDPKNPVEATEVPAGMVLHLIGDDFRIIHPKDAELILNDGILNRMRIKIELGR